MSRPPNSDNHEPFVITTPEPRRPSARAVLFAGVAGACVLGMGLGLWARPAMHERQAALAGHLAAPAVAKAAVHRLEIVVADHPRPMTAAPLEVLSPAQAAAAGPAFAPPRAAPVPLAPTRPPEGLIKASASAAPSAAQPHDNPSLRAMLPGVAAAFTAARLTLARMEHPEPQVAVAKSDHTAELQRAQARELEIARADAARAEAHRAALAKAEAEQAEQAEVDRAKADRLRAEIARNEIARAEAAKAQAQKLALAKAAAAKAEAHRVALARADAQRAVAQKAAAQRLEAQKAEAARLELAKAEATKAAAHKLELARRVQADKAEKAETVRLAKAEARAKAAQREEARLEALADAAEAQQKAQRARLAHAKAAPPVELAKVDRRHAAAARELKEQASVTSRKRRDPPRLMVVGHPARAARPEPMAPQANDGLVRVSTSPRCASRDPGEALVCADPTLSAAERQLARAYQGARNAGVPDGELQRGQARWLAARSAAAREAPWAVRDVYMARIAELNGQAKDAQGSY